MSALCFQCPATDKVEACNLQATKAQAPSRQELVSEKEVTGQKVPRGEEVSLQLHSRLKQTGCAHIAGW